MGIGMEMLTSLALALTTLNHRCLDSTLFSLTPYYRTRSYKVFIITLLGMALLLSVPDHNPRKRYECWRILLFHHHD